jgi:hypothetical protein
LAQVDDGGGPKFGSEGLTIPLEKNNPRLVRSKLGLYYEKIPGAIGKTASSLLPGGMGQDELSELEVFVGVYAKGEKIPYDDALFFQIN